MPMGHGQDQGQGTGQLPHRQNLSDRDSLERSHRQRPHSDPAPAEGGQRIRSAVSYSSTLTRALRSAQ